MKPLLASAALLGASLPLFAQTFSLESAVLDSRNSQNLGVTHENGEINQLFKAQKALTFGILRSAGIPIESLSPELRARIERFQTTNIGAFRAFSQGLDLKDQGRYAEAKAAFAKAAQLDPGFALAVEQQQAMPEATVGSEVQMRAVIAQTAGAALASGKAAYAIDVAHALAALSAGQTVIASYTPLSSVQLENSLNYSVNPPGSGSQFQPNLGAGISYNYTQPGSNGGTLAIGIANTNEWLGDQYVAPAGTLTSLGSAGGFLAQQAGATIANQGSTVLADGTVAYWGSWISQPGHSASVTVNNAAITATPTAPANATLGQVDYVFAEATHRMPGSGSVSFTPVAGAGTLAAPSGAITVNFGSQNVSFNNLAFTVGSNSFSGLTGNANYSSAVASGYFSGNYSAGSCSGCAAFAPTSSAFGGNFVGKGASGLVFSTILVTGGGISSGVNLFKP